MKHQDGHKSLKAGGKVILRQIHNKDCKLPRDGPKAETNGRPLSIFKADTNDGEPIGQAGEGGFVHGEKPYKKFRKVSQPGG